jgi:phosphate transport system regulatory protein PhoU
MSRRGHDLEGLSADLRKMMGLVLYQLRQALSSFQAQDLAQAEAVIERDDVIDSLNISLEGRVFELVGGGRLSGRDVRAARASAKVTANLERAGDSGTHIAKHVRMIHHDKIEPGSYQFPDVEAVALGALKEAAEAFLDGDLDMARRACLREPELDEAFKTRMHEITKLIQADPPQAPYLLHCLTVLKYMEKVADYTLNIGEQAIYLVTGRRLKFPQFLELERLTGDARIEDYDFRPYWDGISGAIVARVEAPDAAMIYKEGLRRKIEQETEKLKTWQRIADDLTPRVLGSVSIDDRQALLREYVDGALLSDLYLSSAPREAKLRATRRLLDVVEFIWQTTLTPTPPLIDYVEQIRGRLADAFVLHPHLWDKAKSGAANGRRLPPLEDLLDRAGMLQAQLAPPFSVWLHGDFNANNVVYNAESEQIKFIDVHRSRPGDYVQDVGVFLLAVVRRPDLTPAMESDVAAINEAVEEFACGFARRRGDTSFSRRLKLSLARSCLTSMRVTIDPAKADQLLHRGMILLDEVVSGH